VDMDELRLVLESQMSTAAGSRTGH